MVDHKRIEQEFDSYCKKVIKNKFLDCMRMEKRISENEISIEIVSESKFVADDNLHVQIIVFDDEEFVIKNDCLHEALAKLSEESLRIIMFYYFFNMTDSEIAELMGIKRTAARNKRYRIIANLQNHFNVRDECL